MATIVLAHGAWSAGWAWKKMRPLFAAGGHEFYSPTYTGVGERAHQGTQCGGFADETAVALPIQQVDVRVDLQKAW